MIHHIILMKIKPDTEQEKIDTLIKTLNEISTRLSIVKKSSCGRNFTQRNQEFTLGYLTEFETKEDLQKYADDPYHLEVRDNLILPIVDGLVAVDYES